MLLLTRVSGLTSGGENMENNNVENNMLNFEKDKNPQQTDTLSDERRVKVMSPSMLVFKRFIRNKLAVIGFIILAFMFLFSFVGPFFSPYKSRDRFYTFEEMAKEYAEFKVIGPQDWKYLVRSDEYLAAAMQATAKLSSKEPSFVYEDSNGKKQTGYLTYIGDRVAILSSQYELARYVDGEVTASDSGTVLSEELVALIIQKSQELAAAKEKEGTLEFEGVTYKLVKQFNPEDRLQTIYSVSTDSDIGILHRLSFHSITDDKSLEALFKDYEFVKQALIGFANGGNAEFNMGTDRFRISALDSNGYADVLRNNQMIAKITNYNLGPKVSTFLSFEYKEAARQACEQVKSGKGTFTFPDADGNEVEYEVELKDFYYTITRIEQTYMLARYKAPFTENQLNGKPSINPLGTEESGFDVLTRLMYGGRISLMVGFVVVFIEIIIGVIMGGVAGYFSGWVDVIIMRFIELFNCIPFYPLLMIIVAGLDAARVGNSVRIMLLMAVLGILSWPGIARIVRGQILSLREQDFMVAAEATGLPVGRRIFRHLIPNVVPLLIVSATMSLGGIIITEATLSFLGLGVKYPAASWGSIINQANDFVVMSQYWWVWIPAGILILLTVLGFNFVGDGLRDAFDPKMKR